MRKCFLLIVLVSLISSALFAQNNDLRGEPLFTQAWIGTNATVLPLQGASFGFTAELGFRKFSWMPEGTTMGMSFRNSVTPRSFSPVFSDSVNLMIGGWMRFPLLDSDKARIFVQPDISVGVYSVGPATVPQVSISPGFRFALPEHYESKAELEVAPVINLNMVNPSAGVRIGLMYHVMGTEELSPEEIAERNARIEAEKARIAAEKAQREAERLAARQAREAEKARLAAERARQREEARLAREAAKLAAQQAREAARLAREAERARKAEERARLAAEKARQREEERLAREAARLAAQQAREAARLAREAEKERLAAERARQREEERLAREAAKLAAQQAREEARLAREAEKERLAAERARQREEERLAREAEKERLAAEKARREEEERLAREAELARIAAEKARREEEERLAREAELARIAAEKARREEEERLAREAEAARLAAEKERAAREAEEARRRALASMPAPYAELSVETQEGGNLTPDGDGLNDALLLKPSVHYLSEPEEDWEIVISDAKGSTFRTFKGAAPLPETIVWDGLSDSGETVFSLNNYNVELSITPAAADQERIGRLSVKTTQTVRTGLLLQVIIPGKEWKIMVNSIFFDPDKATFNTLSPSQIAANNEALDAVVAEIIAHPGTDVIVEGFANNISNTVEENERELLPLSQERAESIVQQLIKRGIPASILSSQGMGDASPLAEWDDVANWWKNRRVEFILRKE